MKRRIFLKHAALISFQATVSGLLSGCGLLGRGEGDREEGAEVAVDFPQGVASADPRPDSVVLWTRAEPHVSDIDAVAVWLEVAPTASFNLLLLQQRVVAYARQDFTLHVRVDGLSSDTVYFYRFRSVFGDQSLIGRTWTAPAAGSLDAVNFAFVSCQERKHGFYGAWRRMLKDDLAAAPEDQLRFVLHLGDFIYETDEEWQQPLDEANEPITGGLVDVSGQLRDIGAFPDGATSRSGIRHAVSLADYRHLYRRYLSDPDLLAARARWPFVCIWDDHEFSDDCWQSEANYDDDGPNASTDEPSQRRKVAANQAWSEYIPVDYGLPETASNPAHAFEFAEVEDVSNAQPNPDNEKALNSLAPQRHLRFGGLFDLLLTDNRSWRSDHAVPEEVSANGAAFLHPRAAMPLAFLNTLDAGRTAFNGNPPAFVSVGGVPYLNPRRQSPPGSILGEAQKRWWKQVMQASDTRWRIWGNSVPLLRMKLDLSTMSTVLPDVVVSSDAWDGYASERRELMDFLRNEGIANVVSLSGDVHAHFAGLVKNDYDDPAGEVLAVEVVTAAVSSQSMFEGVEVLSRRDRPSSLEAAVRSLIVVTDPDDPNRLMPNLDVTLLKGVDAGLAAAQGADPETLPVDPQANPHLRHVDTSAHGYGLARVTAEEMQVRLVALETIIDNARADQVKSVARFRVPQHTAGESPVIENF